SVGTIGICLAVFSFLTFAQKTTTSPVLKTRAVNHHTGVLLDEYFRRAAAHGFSGSVIVAQGKRVWLRKGYGTIDRRMARPVAPNTVFSLASLDKQFIAAAVLRLEETGKLSVD